MKDARPIAEIKADLSAAIVRLKEIDAEIARIEGLWKERATLSDRHGRYGKIALLKNELSEARRLADDANRPIPVWIREQRGDERYVITRITPKRIYMRYAGHERENIFHRSTGNQYDWGSSRLDVDATIVRFREWEASQ